MKKKSMEIQPPEKKKTSQMELDKEKAAKAERSRRGGRACLATYGRKFYQEIARKRHAKKKQQE